mgnify:CR=1 FL=1
MFCDPDPTVNPWTAAIAAIAIHAIQSKLKGIPLSIYKMVDQKPAQARLYPLKNMWYVPIRLNVNVNQFIEPVVRILTPALK